MRRTFPLFLAIVLACTVAVQARGWAALPQTITVSPAGGETSKRVTIGLNKTLIVELDTEAREVLVSKPEIVDAVVRSPKRIYLMAQKTGQTNAYFFDAAGRQILTLDIEVEEDVGSLKATLKKTFPDARIDVTTNHGAVVLSGNMTSATDIVRAKDIAANFVGNTSKVFNQLQVKGSEQVMLKVRIAELQRTVTKQLGIDLTSLAGTMASPWGSASLTGSITGMSISNAATLTVKANNFNAAVRALETMGLMHTLAEPNLITVSGESAKFLAGGEFPVASGRDSSGNVSVTFKQYGVGLSFTPVVLSPGLISLKLATEVSQLTNTGALTISSGTTSTSTDTSSTSSGTTTTTSSTTTIPALTVRRAETTIELPSGGTFAIAGLLQHVTKQSLDGTPWLKDLPVLGALFRSRDYQNDETEMVVMVTAYLVNPVQEAKLDLPTDGFVVPTDLETILLGRLNATYKKGQTPLAPRGEVGFIVQ
jgi:pilus assembly protein CpaC